MAPEDKKATFNDFRVWWLQTQKAAIQNVGAISWRNRTFRSQQPPITLSLIGATWVVCLMIVLSGS